MLEPDVAQWLTAFAQAVRDRDLDAGRALFRADAWGYGTVAEAYTDLDELVERQWSDVWPRTRDFAFDLDAARAWGDGTVRSVAAPWSSTGVDPGGTTWIRHGRSTFALVLEDGHWLAAHSHFSMTPGATA